MLIEECNTREKLVAQAVRKLEAEKALPPALSRQMEVAQLAAAAAKAAQEDDMAGHCAWCKFLLQLEAIDRRWAEAEVAGGVDYSAAAHAPRSRRRISILHWSGRQVCGAELAHGAVADGADAETSPSMSTPSATWAPGRDTSTSTRSSVKMTAATKSASWCSSCATERPAQHSSGQHVGGCAKVPSSGAADAGLGLRVCRCVRSPARSSNEISLNGATCRAR
jgi:hypothetical protein